MQYQPRSNTKYAVAQGCDTNRKLRSSLNQMIHSWAGEVRDVKPAREKQIDINGRVLTKHEIANVCSVFSQTLRHNEIYKIIVRIYVCIL